MAKLCIMCRSTGINEVVKDNYRYFFCQRCQKLYERSIDTDYGKDVIMPSERGICHLCVGGLLRKDNKFLMLKRRVYAFGYSFPSGHVEYHENPIDTLKREVMEETSLHVTGGIILFKGEVPNHKCRYGADCHIWTFYDCEFEPGEVALNPESESYGWYTMKEINELDLVPQARYLYENVLIPNA